MDFTVSIESAIYQQLKRTIVLYYRYWWLWREATSTVHTIYGNISVVCYQVGEQVLLYYIDNIGNKSMQTKVDLLYQNDLTDEYC